MYHTYEFVGVNNNYRFKAGEIDFNIFRNLSLSISTLMQNHLDLYQMDTTSSVSIVFRAKKGGAYLNNAVDVTIYNYNNINIDTFTYSSFTNPFIEAATCTFNELVQLQNMSSSQKYTDAELTRLVSITNQVYEMCRASFIVYTKVSNLCTVFQDLYAYQWNLPGGQPPQVYSFNTGSYLGSQVVSSSFRDDVLGIGSTSSNGVRDVLNILSNAQYEANYNAMVQSLSVSLLFFKKGNTVADTLTNAINGKYSLIRNTYAYFTLNSNGDVTSRFGRKINIRLISYVTARPIGDMANAQKLIVEEEEESGITDVDNTYPGGGEDKNDYPDGDESGKGDFDNTNDTIDFPTLPTWDVQSTGFVSIWNPTIIQLTDLYAWLWDANGSDWESFVTTLSKMFSNPMEAIFGLGIIPVDVVSGGMRNVSIGHIDTGIQMNSVQSQFSTFDFGSIDCTEYYGAAWDYSPYTKTSIYLPYIGIMDIDVDDVMNCTLTLRYNVDVVTGTVVALLKSTRKGRDNLNAVMYEWQGNCMTQCPITASDWSQKMASFLQIGAMTGLALSQPRAGQSIQNGEENNSEEQNNRQLVSAGQYLNSALNVITSKVHVQRGGRLDLSAGAMSMQSAFLIINRPVSAIPRGWNNYVGYPSLKIKKLSSQQGYTEVAAIKLNGLRATSEEIQELDTILKAGVIL